MTHPQNYPQIGTAMNTPRPQGPTMAGTDTREHGMPLTEHPAHTDQRPPRSRSRGDRLVIGVAGLVTVLAIIGITILVTSGDKAAIAPPLTATTAPSTQPTQQSPEDQAAATAQARYRDFLRVVDAVGIAGFVSDAPLKAVAVPPELVVQQLTVRQSKPQGRRQNGYTRLTSLSVSSVDLTPPAGGYPEVVLQACVDVSGVDVTDRTGKSVVSAGRAPRSKSTVTMYAYKKGTVGAEAGGWYVYQATAKNEPC